MELDYNFEELFPNAPKNIQDAEAKFIDVLDRGVFRHRLNVALPPEITGQWVKNTPSEVSRLSELGYIIDTKFATNSVLSSTNGSPIVDDVVHMIAPKYVRDAYEKHQHKLFLRNQGQRDQGKIDAVAEEFHKNSAFPIIDESKESAITGEDIARILNKKEG